MKINSNFELNHRSIEEFARVMVPEALEENLDISCVREDGNIIVNMKAGNREKSFIYPDQYGKIEDQEVTMTKILLLKLFDKNYSWGGLMGVRPTKVVRRYLNLGYNYDEIHKILKEFMVVSDEKIDLLIEVVKKELEFLDRDHINLYIGIPFCPTKCKYCSFASYEINGGVGRYYNDFVKTLLEEIKLAGKFLKKEELKISSIYIGGGTPSTLKQEYWNGNIKWMSSGELNLKFIYDVQGRITDLGLKNSSTKIIPEQCILIGLAGQGKTRGTVAINFIELCTNQSVAAILPNFECFKPMFLYYNLDNRYEELRSLSTGSSGRGGLNLNILKNISSLFPIL